VVSSPSKYILELTLSAWRTPSLDKPVKTTTRSPSKGTLDGALTVDLEDWRCALNPDKHADYRRRPLPSEEYLLKSTSNLLRELDGAGAKATFFVLGEVAEVVPEIVENVARKGHEIASHSPVHLPPTMIPKHAYENLLRRDITLLEQLSGERPRGFRVPYMAVKRHDGWLIEMLSRLGFSYDSSIAPTWTPYWGIPFAPKHPYFPNSADIGKRAAQGSVLEIPLTVWPSWNILPGLPVAGGFYMRAWPAPVLRWMLRRNVRNGVPLNLYIHPGNLESNKERVADPTIRDRVSQYAGSNRGITSFRAILSEFKFGTLYQIYKEIIDATGKRNQV
jgi:polysaccharide deacetylase family protein (PEP-CTERM system associated)